MSSNQARFQNPQNESVDERCESAMQWTERAIDEMPLASICVAFSAGLILGAGAVAGYSLSHSRKSRFQTDHLADRILHSLSDRVPQSWKH